MHYPIALKFGTLKGGIKAHPDTKFCCNTINGHEVINNFSKKSHQYVFMPTGLTANGKKLKLARRQGNYWTSNLLLFERNWAKDHDDTAKNLTVGNNYAIEIYW